ncbi:hypothetical protein MRB56_12635 [Halomonas cupida]|uniref:hypothetical protein n=1 Tax=Halomonas cupida TaxID=44933 RepID=UPI0039B5E4DB
MAKTYKTGLVITGDASGGIKAMRATEGEIEKLNRSFSSGKKRAQEYTGQTRNVSRELEFLKRMAAPAAAALAGVFAVNSLQSQVDWADRLQKLNLRIGASTEALSQYNYVASLSGLEFNQLATAWQRQTRRIAQATQGTGEAVKALKALGLSAAELSRLSPEQQFEAIAAELQKVENSGQRAAIAMQLWDSEGVGLLQIVTQGTEAIAAMRAEADRLGLTISQQTADNMATLNDEMDRLRFAGQGLAATLVSDVGPSLTSSLQEVNAFIHELGGAGVVLERVGQVVTTLAAVYLARRLGPALLAAGTKGVTAGGMIAQGMVVATGATGRLNQTLVLTQGRMAATAAAGRALAGSVALLGGPLGAAMLAAGAVYYFREELGLVPKQAGLTTDELEELRGEIDDLSDAAINNRLDQLSKDLEDVTLKAAAAREEMAALSKEAGGYGVTGFSSGHVGDVVEASTAVADARDKITRINQQIAELQGEREKRRSPGGGDGEDNDPPLKPPSKDIDAAKKALEELEREYESLHGRLREQVALFGETGEAARLRYQLEHGSLSQLSDARKQNLIGMAEELDGLREQQEVVQSLFPELEKLRNLAQQSAAVEELDGGLGNLARRRLQDQLGGMASDGAPSMNGLDATVSGPFGEANRLDSEMERYQAWYTQRLELLREFENEQYGVQAEALAAREALEEQHQQTVQKYEQQSASARMQGYGALFGNLADMAGKFAGEQSGLYKAMFAASKAFAIADSAVQIANGIAKAANNPWPVNLAAMATVAANTASIISTIQGTSMDVGQLHAGIDDVPETGSWYLKKGERVVDDRTNRDLKTFLGRAKAGGGGSSGNVASMPSMPPIEQHFHVSGDMDAKQRALLEQAAAMGAEQGYQRVYDDFATNGKIRAVAGV